MKVSYLTFNNFVWNFTAGIELREIEEGRVNITYVCFVSGVLIGTGEHAFRILTSQQGPDVAKHILLWKSMGS